MKIIVFEGLDGSGKTTLINKVRSELEKQGQEVIILQGLGSSSIGLSLRDFFLTNSQLKPLTRYWLSFANMFQIQEEMIKPYTNTNKIILIDRWLGSNFAYQAYPHQIDQNYQTFNKLTKLFLKPNITVYLQIEPQLGLQRKLNQPNHQLDVIETNPLSYFKQVRQGYESFLQRKNLGHKLILKTMNDKNYKFNQNQIIKQIGELLNGDHN